VAASVRRKKEERKEKMDQTDEKHANLELFESLGRERVMAGCKKKKTQTRKSRRN